MSKTIVVVIGIALLLVLLLFSMTYTVSFHEVAIKTRFGKTSAGSVIRDPGLNFRLPLIADKVTTLDTRLQLRESAMETVLTTDGQEIVARAYLLWQVENDPNGDGPLRFYGSFPGGIEEANQSMYDKFKTEITSGLSRFRFDDLIGPKNRLEDAEKAILAGMMSEKSKGILPVSVGISQLVLPNKTAQAVLGRMEAERTKLSESERSRGDAQATAIQSLASGQAAKIKAFAEQRAAEIRSQGDKDSAKINAALAKDGGEDLAIFELWLDTLRSTLQQQTTIILPWTYAPFHLLKLDQPSGNQPIPMPKVELAPTAPATPPASGGS